MTRILHIPFLIGKPSVSRLSSLPAETLDSIQTQHRRAQAQLWLLCFTRHFRLQRISGSHYVCEEPVVEITFIE